MKVDGWLWLALGSAHATSAMAQQSGGAPEEHSCCPIVELRQYTAYPGKRDSLITLFEDKFVEGHDEAGMKLVGLFRDSNNPNRLVWLRGFESMAARERELNAFYSGPVWQASRGLANQLLFENDNVLLLHPAAETRGFNLAGLTHEGADGPPSRTAFMIGTIYHFEGSVDTELVALFGREIKPLFERAGAQVVAQFVTDTSANTFPRLPVRERERTFVTFMSFANRAAYDRYLDNLSRDQRWSAEFFSVLYKNVKRPPELLMLEPTRRSLLGH
jgi:quinol monooxygenase YgiN